MMSLQNLCEYVQLGDEGMGGGGAAIDFSLAYIIWEVGCSCLFGAFLLSEGLPAEAVQ